MSKLREGMNIDEIAAFWGMHGDEDVASRIIEEVGDILERSGPETLLMVLRSLSAVDLADVPQVLADYAALVNVRGDLQDYQKAIRDKMKEILEKL